MAAPRNEVADVHSRQASTRGGRNAGARLRPAARKRSAGGGLGAVEQPADVATVGREDNGIQFSDVDRRPDGRSGTCGRASSR
jgi:hypothetical protein